MAPAAPPPARLGAPPEPVGHLVTLKRTGVRFRQTAEVTRARLDIKYALNWKRKKKPKPKPFLECMKNRMLIIAQEQREELEELEEARRVLRPEEEPLDIDWDALEEDADEGNAEGADDYEAELLRDDGDGMDELVADFEH